jgi:hypothetical protein
MRLAAELHGVATLKMGGAVHNYGGCASEYVTKKQGIEACAEELTTCNITGLHIYFHVR